MMTQSDKTQRLLLIEDNRDIAEMVYAYLERRGFEMDSQPGQGTRVSVTFPGATNLHMLLTADMQESL
jgi:DNA-binding response OmpR family regulator